MRFVQPVLAYMLLGGSLVACGGGALDPGAGDDPGSGSLTLAVDADVEARPTIANAKDDQEFTTEFHVRVQKGGVDVTAGTVTVRSRAGDVALTYGTDNRWHGVQVGYWEVYELAVESGTDFVDGVGVDGPALHYFSAPLPGATVDSLMPLVITWKRGEAADRAMLDTDKIDELAISDSGTFSLPAGSLKSKGDAVEQERIRLERAATVIPTGAVAGSQMRVSVRNDIEVLVLATGL
jgi:hypothetical protein